ncbi:hypothetical protein AB0C59_07610 [Streptomyces sp. NPDC048664]|uniref:hypothetical protein n=1 Tax=Streptomyces sp. NPDC048664 TaxID=3154505 RepID=UPI0034400CBF
MILQVKTSGMAPTRREPQQHTPLSAAAARPQDAGSPARAQAPAKATFNSSI